MEALSVNELKSICAARKLPVSGTKAELIERITKGSSSSSSARSSTNDSVTNTNATSSKPPPTPTDAGATLFPSDYEGLTIPQLKELCRERLLPVGGIKDDLVARLNASDPHKMTLVQLKDKCRDANLPVTGTKSDLVERIIRNMTSGTAAMLQTKSVDELKDLCRERGLPVGGKKDDLIARIKQGLTAPPKTTEATATKSSATASGPHTTATASKKSKTPPVIIPAYETLTVEQLKEICRGRGLPVSGTKEQLVERLRQALLSASSATAASAKRASSSTPSAASSTTSDSTAAYATMTIPQLKDLCRDRTLPVTGTKYELVSRLEKHDDIVRATFKQRKSTSNSSLTSTPPATTTTTISSGAKRKASSSEPSAKKQKTTEGPFAVRRYGFGDDSTVPPAARKNYAAFSGLPPTAVAPRKSKAAPKNAPSTKKSPQPSMSGRYIVYSTCAYPPDGWHSYAGPGEPRFYESYATVGEANARVEQIFYGKNPWGISREEMDDKDIDEEYERGTNLLRLTVCPPDSEEWMVAVKDRGAPADEDEDEDVVMISGSDDETEDEEHYPSFKFTTSIY